MAVLGTAELILATQCQNMKRSMEALDKLRVTTVETRRSSCLSAIFSQSQERLTPSPRHNNVCIKRSLSTSYMNTTTVMVQGIMDRTRSEVWVTIEPALVSKRIHHKVISYHIK